MNGKYGLIRGMASLKGCIDPLDPTEFTAKFPQNSPELLSKSSKSKWYQGLPIYQNEIISFAL